MDSTSHHHVCIKYQEKQCRITLRLQSQTLKFWGVSIKVASKIFIQGSGICDFLKECSVN